MHHVVRCLFVLSLVLPAVARSEEPSQRCSKKACPVAQILTSENCPQACATKACATKQCAAKKCAAGETACAKGQCSTKACASSGCQSCPAASSKKPCPASAYLAESCPNANCDSKTCCQAATADKHCATGCDTSACTTAACTSCGCPEQKLEHLLAAAHHLHAAGLNDAANDVFEAAREVRRDLLRIKLDELARLRWEVERLESGEPLFEPPATANVPSDTPTK